MEKEKEKKGKKRRREAQKKYYKEVGDICIIIKEEHDDLIFESNIIDDVPYDGIVIGGLCEYIVIHRDWFKSKGYYNTHVILEINNSHEIDYNWMIPLKYLQSLLLNVIHEIKKIDKIPLLDGIEIMRSAIQKEFDSLPMY
jgi:hypothetical protein